ncbi:Ig-like domain-containing protein [Myroides sp. M-43]|uniref:Ig-like domain-containing protein n=1 Tax=Myroides oncorhynchi TaxID=2893756 RepID=UPI001E34D0BA|nr:Ig-like domain-containing protein [Myroides oncorhynchi]MCC9041988.1 Ig-like domain-containing protein [Myroides oncorhynchi]
MSKFRIYFIVCFTIFCFITFSNCAKRGFISGGDKDTIPPVVLGSSPKNLSTHFDKKQITINFDEYVKIKNVNQNLIISPPMEKMPEVLPMGNARKTVTINLIDSLKPNTTYSFNFGDAITDNNEGNVLKQFKYIFSTGDYIDSLKVGGTIKSANQLKADNFVNVMLYQAENFNDSTIYKQKPLYVTNTLDSLTTFSIENVKAGKYYLVALKDKNNNFMFNAVEDKIAFIKEPIELPTDQTFDLTLFKSDENFIASRPAQITQNKWYLPYTGNPKGAKIEVKKDGILLPSTYTYLPEKDSLQVWFPKIEADSLHFTATKGDFTKTFTVKPRPKMKEIDSLSVNGKSGTLDFISDLLIETTTPVKEINKNLITIFNKDSVAVPFELDNKMEDQKLYLKFKKEELNEYKVTLWPGAIQDFFGKANDTIILKNKTSAYTDYGNLTITLNGIKRFPVIIELLDEKEKVVVSQYSDKSNIFEFTVLPPRQYYIRVIYDDNKNGKWDTGYYWDKKQPEETIYFPEKIDVRANWDIKEQINL